MSTTKQCQSASVTMCCQMEVPNTPWNTRLSSLNCKHWRLLWNFSFKVRPRGIYVNAALTECSFAPLTWNSEVTCMECLALFPPAYMNSYLTFDLSKTRPWLGIHFGPLNIQSLVDVMVFFSAVREEGLLNLWKGLSPAVLRHMGTCNWY